MTRGAEAASAPVAKDAPTEQQAARPGTPKKFEKGQTVCNEKNEKGKLCNGHLKQVSPVGEDARQHLRGDDLLYRCQTCGALYTGPPLGHVRDPNKQARYIEQELAAILQAAGGTLPAFKKNEAGAWIPASEPAPHAAAPAAATTKPAAAQPAPITDAPQPPTTPDAETPEQKRARIIAEAKAKAAAKVAAKSEPSNAAPPATAAVDAASGESVEEKRARIMAEVKAKAAAKMAAAKSGTDAESAIPSVLTESKGAHAAPPPAPADAPGGETPEQKRARIMAEVKAKAAAKMAAKGSANTGVETSIATPPTTAQPPSPTSGTDSSAAADAHRPAAEAQAATGQASAAPMSPAASTASPAAGAETVSDLAPQASTELTPGAPADERLKDGGTTT